MDVIGKRPLALSGLACAMALSFVAWRQHAIAWQPRISTKEVCLAFLRHIGERPDRLAWSSVERTSHQWEVVQVRPGATGSRDATTICVNPEHGLVVGYFVHTVPPYTGDWSREHADSWRARLGLPKDWRRLDVSDGFRLRGGKTTAFRFVEFPFGYEPFEDGNGAAIAVGTSGRLYSYSRAVGYRALPPPDRRISVADGFRIAAKKRTDPKAEVRFHKTMYVVPNDRFGGKRRKDPKELVLARVYQLSDRQYLFLDAGDGKALGGFEVSPTRRVPKLPASTERHTPGGG